MTQEFAEAQAEVLHIYRDALIERACEWLGNINLAHYFYGRKYIKDGIEGMEFLFTSDFYNDFQKAMNQ